MKPELTLIPTITVHPDRINFYNQIVWEPFRPSREKSILESNLYINSDGEIVEKQKTEYSHLLNSARTAQGFVSKIAKRKIERAIEYMLFMTEEKTANLNYSGRKWKFKVSFVTLTLSSKQIHSDNELKEKLLNQILIEFKKYYGVKNYIWRAEKQKNGNIHFHILLDKFIAYNELRNRWNRIQNKLGYVDRYRASMKEFHKDGFTIRKDLLKNWPKEKQEKAYRTNKSTDWQNPNSTDIHSLQKVYNIKKYVSKYVTKNDKELREKLTELQETEPDLASELIKTKLVQGRLWGCSTMLSNIKGCVIEIGHTISDELQQLVEAAKFFTIDDTYYSITFVKAAELLTEGCKQIFTKFMDYMYSTFGYSYQFAMSP